MIDDDRNLDLDRTKLQAILPLDQRTARILHRLNPKKIILAKLGGQGFVIRCADDVYAVLVQGAPWGDKKITVHVDRREAMAEIGPTDGWMDFTQYLLGDTSYKATELAKFFKQPSFEDEDVRDRDLKQEVADRILDPGWLARAKAMTVPKIPLHSNYGPPSLYAKQFMMNPLVLPPEVPRSWPGWPGFTSDNEED